MKLPDPSGMPRESQLTALRVCFEVAIKLVYPSQYLRYLVAHSTFEFVRQGASEEALLCRWQGVLSDSLWWRN